jgi:hypothetical protein
VTDQDVPAPATEVAPAQPQARPAVRPPGGAGIGSIFVLAFLVILVPGVAVYLVTHALGLALAPSTLLGLLTVIVCLALYPSVLVRLGWVKRRPRGAGRGPDEPADLSGPWAGLGLASPAGRASAGRGDTGQENPMSKPSKLDASSSAAAKAPRGMVSIHARYYGLRVLLFGVVTAVVLLLGVSTVPGIFLSFVISGVLSLPLALQQRRATQRAAELRRGGQ